MIRRLSFVLAASLLASCSGFGMSPMPGSTNAGRSLGLSPFSCYSVKQAPTTVKATITFYGWPDNSPPGNSIAHPVIHQVASGDGTYCNPTTFATEPSNDKIIPYGIKIYVPFLKQYFIREDDCTASGPPTGSGSNGCYKLWFDLWIGGNAASNMNAVVACERRLTPSTKVDVILYPRANMPVAFAGPLYRNNPPPRGTCHGTPMTTLPN